MPIRHLLFWPVHLFSYHNALPLQVHADTFSLYGMGQFHQTMFPPYILSVRLLKEHCPVYQYEQQRVEIDCSDLDEPNQHE